MANFLLRRKLATPRPAGGVPSAPKPLLVMTRKQDRGGLSPGPAYIVSEMVEAAGGRVMKQGALPHQALTWGFPPSPKSV